MPFPGEPTTEASEPIQETTVKKEKKKVTAYDIVTWFKTRDNQWTRNKALADAFGIKYNEMSSIIAFMVHEGKLAKKRVKVNREEMVLYRVPTSLDILKRAYEDIEPLNVPEHDIELTTIKDGLEALISDMENEENDHD